MIAFAAGENAWRMAALTMMSEDELRDTLHGDTARASAWVRAAADYGLADAQVLLGRMLLAGEGVKKDECEAVRWFVRAAEAGHAEAENMLGRCYENGWGVAKNMRRAAEWFSRSAAANNVWAQYNLGHLYLEGFGVPRDYRKAFALYRRAAGQGHARAMNLVGRCYENGWGVARDPTAAKGWYRRSAHAGYFRGAFNHATILAKQRRIICAQFWLNTALRSAPTETQGRMRTAWARLAAAFQNPDDGSMLEAALGAVDIFNDIALSSRC